MVLSPHTGSFKHETGTFDIFIFLVLHFLLVCTSYDHISANFEKKKKMFFWTSFYFVTLQIKDYFAFFLNSVCFANMSNIRFIQTVGKRQQAMGKANRQQAIGNRQQAIGKLSFLKLWFGSVNSTPHIQDRVQRSFYSDQTKKYIYKYKSTLQYNKSKGNPFMGIIKMKL